MSINGPATKCAPLRYKQILDIIQIAKPQVICEVGTWNGVRACEMCATALRFQKQVQYVGFDLFEGGTEHLDGLELNGKPRCAKRSVIDLLRSRFARDSGLSFHLEEGNTRETLHGKNICADLCFIDGGHSVATISGDFLALRSSKMIIFDDYYIGGNIDVGVFGCNAVVATMRHLVLPQWDWVREGDRVHLVMRVNSR